jgi:prevent-host-death family protein
MSLPERLPLGEAKNRLSEVVDRVEREHGRVVITKHGREAAVVLSLADLQSLEETLAILSQPGLLAEIRQGQKDLAAGRGERLTREQARALVSRG